MDLFCLNPAKKVIQIGAWLRNSYAIYDLDVPPGYHKFALKGKDMDNYFIDDEDMETIDTLLRDIRSDGSVRTSNCLVSSVPDQSIKTNQTTNKHIVGLLQNIKDNYKSVTVLDNITNPQYDELLRSSIVFINLVDASAVNTILECIVRNTPILVNRLPATEEYLGSSYPLFYNSMNHANDLLSDIRSIRRAHQYLLNMDKTKFTIEYFLDSLIKSEIYQSNSSQ